MCPQNITVQLKLSVHDNIYANCGAIAVIESTTYMELFAEWPAPSSCEMMIIVDHDNNLFIEWRT